MGSPVCTGLGSLWDDCCTFNFFVTTSCNNRFGIKVTSSTAPILQGARIHDHLPWPVHQILTLAYLRTDLDLPRVLLIELLTMLSHLLLLLILILRLTFLLCRSNFLLQCLLDRQLECR